MYIEIAVLKKHYHAILRSLPSDHMTSLGRLSQVISIGDTVVDRIISCSTSQESNGEVLDALIDTTAADGSLAKFCNAVEKIVGSRPPAVESLRSGKHTCVYIHVYMHTYVHTYKVISE